jgi:hypothetical protein
MRCGFHMDEIQARIKTVVTHKTLGEWLQTWLDTYAVDRCQPKTLERYRQLAGYITTPAEALSSLGGVPLPELTHQQIEAGLDGLLHQKGQPSHTSPLARITPTLQRHVARGRFCTPRPFRYQRDGEDLLPRLPADDQRAADLWDTIPKGPIQ